MKRFACGFLAFVVAAFAGGPTWCVAASSQTYQFTYQGQLRQNGSPANGSFDFDFRLYDSVTGGNQVGAELTQMDVPVTDGLFTVTLNYPGAFDGVQLWLEVTVNNSVMSPRTQIGAVPVAQYALSGMATPVGAASGALSGFYPSPNLATNSVGTQSIQAHAVDHTKIAGAYESFNGGISVADGACVIVPFNVNGAAVGDMPIVTLGAGATPPKTLMLGLPSVTSAGHVSLPVCNLGSTAVNTGTVGLIVQTIH